MGIFGKLGEGLKKTRDSFAQMLSFSKIDADLYEELEEQLILADVGVVTSTKISGLLEQRVKQQGAKTAGEVKSILREILTELLQGGEEPAIFTGPAVILVIGVNGVGKTTTIGKLSAYFKREGKDVILGAADTFRAAAVEQLEEWARRSGVPLIKQGAGADPAAVVFDTVSAGKARGSDVIIIDTAGRLHNKKNLMEELAKIGRVIEREAPSCGREVLLVLDATTGQNAINQAREFDQATGITGIVLTKLDGTAKGGIVFAIKDQLGLPIKFVGVGEGLDDLEPFDPVTFVESIIPLDGEGSR